MICHLSPHLFTSHQVGWGQTHIFRFLQKYLTGFNPRLWLGHSRTFPELPLGHFCCVLRVIVLLEGKPSSQSEVLNTLDWVFIKAISIFWCIELFFFSESLSPCCWKTAPQHKAAISTLYIWDDTLHVMSRAASLQTWCLELRFIRPENLVSHSLGVLKVLFLSIPSVFSFVFTEERIEFGHTAIKPRSPR